MQKARTCLYPGDWPRREREALDRSLFRKGLFDTSDAADWSPDTVDRWVRSYGTFLFFVKGRGMLGDQDSPAARATGTLLQDFINDLKVRVQLNSIATILRGMAAILRVIDPGGDRSEVMAAARHFARIAKPSPDRPKINSVGASELYYAGIARMRRLEKDATINPVAGVASGDGLMMAMLAVYGARLKNVHGSRIGIHLVQTRADNFGWRFSPAETKNRKRIEAEFPTSLTPFIGRWLNEIRPFLLGNNNHDAMWLTTRGDPMSRTTVYTRFCDATEQELGIRINPHAVRHIAATSIAVSMPESVRMIPFILNDSDRVAQEHYNLADGLSASFRYLQGFERRRREALAATKTDTRGPLRARPRG